MLGRLVPIIGTLLMSRATRRVAGRHAGKLALAFGAFELWRNYQRTKAPVAGSQTGQQTGPQSYNPSTERPSHRRRRRRIL